MPKTARVSFFLCASFQLLLLSVPSAGVGALERSFFFLSFYFYFLKVALRSLCSRSCPIEHCSGGDNFTFFLNFQAAYRVFFFLFGCLCYLRFLLHHPVPLFLPPLSPKVSKLVSGSAPPIFGFRFFKTLALLFHFPFFFARIPVGFSRRYWFPLACVPILCVFILLPYSSRDLFSSFRRTRCQPVAFERNCSPPFEQMRQRCRICTDCVRLQFASSVSHMGRRPLRSLRCRDTASSIFKLRHVDSHCSVPHIHFPFVVRAPSFFFSIAF